MAKTHSPPASSKTVSDSDTSSLGDQQITDYVPALVTIYDVQSLKYLYINKSAKKILGYDADELLRGGVALVSSLVHPDDAARITAQNQQALERVQSTSPEKRSQAPFVSFEYRLRHKKGHWVWLQTDGNVYRWSDDGKAVQLINVSVDITDRKQAQTELREVAGKLEIRILERTTRLELALEASQMGIWEWDIATGSLLWSGELKKLYGLKPEAPVTYEKYQKMIHPDDRARTSQIIKQAMKTGKPYKVEHRVVWSDRTVHWVYGMGRALLNEGKAVRMMGSSMNLDESKKNELLIKKSEDRYQTFIRNSQEGIWRIEVEVPISTKLSPTQQINLMYKHGYLAEANDAMAAMYGFSSAKSLIGLRLGDLLVQSDPKNNDYLKSFIASGYNLTGAESHEKDKNDQPRIFRNSLVGIVENGKLVRAWGNQQDITATHKAAQALAKSEETLQRQNQYLEILHETAVEINTGLKNPLTVLKTILKRAGDMVNAQQGYIYLVNESNELRVEVATGIYAEHIGHRIDKGEGLAGKIWVTGKPLLVDDYDTWQDRQKKFPKGVVNAVIGLPLISGNQVTGVIALSSDKSKTSFSHEQLTILVRLAELASLALDNARLYQLAMMQEERFRTMADNAPVFIWEAGRNMLCTFFNKQWLNFTGHTLEQESGEGWKHSIHPHDLAICTQTYETAFRARKPFTQEYRLKKYDNTYHWILDTGIPRFSQNGKFIGFIGSCLDIEELKHTRELEETTALLTQQRAELLALNKAKDEFISLASHQLRTPATAVKQYTGMLLEGYVGELGAGQAKMVKTAYESNERQLKIIEDLLRVAHIDAGQVTLVRSATDLVQLVKGVLEDHRSVFQNRNQTTELRVSHKKLSAQVDENKLRMVVENLVDNASKYTPENKAIEIEIIKEKKAAKINIIDTGVGISKKDVPKLFQKFSRVDNPLSTIVGGSGLGLYWAKKIIDLHSGTIEIQSKLHKGTVFTITLPLP